MKKRPHPNFADLDFKTMDFGVAFGGSLGSPLAGGLGLELDALYWTHHH